MRSRRLDSPCPKPIVRPESNRAGSGGGSTLLRAIQIDMLRNERTTTRRPGRCCATQTTMMLNAASGQGNTCRLLVVMPGLTPDGGHLTSGTPGPALSWLTFGVLA